MSIADKLLHLNETKSLLREAINAAGGNLTQETPFREYVGGWLRDQSASLTLDFSKQQYVAKDKVSMFPDRVGFEDIVTFTRASGGGRFNAQGHYEWVGPDKPRIDYDPLTGECLGLLVEEQRTNLLRYSSDFSNAGWIGNIFKTGEFIVSPDGHVNAEKIAANTTGDIHSFYHPVNVPSGGAISFSVFLKKGEYRYAQVSLDTGGRHNRAFITVNLETAAVVLGPKTLGTANAITCHSVEDVGDGWLRCSITTDGSHSLSAASVFLVQDDHINSDIPAYPGDGTSGIYIWGAQLEAGSFPTSYIPTTDAQVTRAADVAIVNELSPWYNSEQGTLFVEAVRANSLSSGTAFLVEMGIGNGTFNERIYAALTATNSNSFVGDWRSGNASPDYFNNTTPKWSPGAPARMALTWGSSGRAAAADGVIVKTSSSAVIPTVTKFGIGAPIVGAGGQLNGYIRSIRYFPRRLPDSELQEITA